MDTHTSLAVSKCSHKNKVCGRDCILISRRPDFRKCAHLNPVVVVADIGKSVNGKTQYPKSIHEKDISGISKNQVNSVLTKSQEVQTNPLGEPARIEKKPPKNETLSDSKQFGTENSSEDDREQSREKFVDTKTPSKRNRKRKLSWDPTAEYEVERILGYRKYKKYKMLYLVQWKNYENCTTLEPIENLTGCIYELMKCLEKNSQPSETEILKKDRELKQMLKSWPLFKELKKNDWKLDNLQLFKTLDLREIFTTKSLSHLEANTEREYRYIVRCLIGMSGYMDTGLVQRGLDYLLYLRLIKRRKKQLQLLHEAEKTINNLEKVLIKLENNVDFDVFPDIKYITEMVLGENLVLPEPVLGCECKKGCCSKSHCCGKLAGSTFAYNNFGRLRLEQKIAIYECNSRCKCDKTCFNRVVQKGRQFKLGIYKTAKCGWGVKALEDIPKGSFVCEYFGELIRNSEALVRDIEYFRLGKWYVFDLDFDEGNNEMYCIDATLCGNVSRFINHSCDPNLMVLPVWVDCLEVNLHRLAFFAIKNIKKNQEITFDYESADSNDQESTEEEKENKGPRVVEGLKCLCAQPKCREWLFGS